MSIAKWSVSKIDAANYCKMRYYLKYIDPNRPKPARLSAYVKGSLLHESIENLWKKNGTPEESNKKKNGKRYYDAESFAKYIQGKWTSIIIADEKAKEKIEWSNENEKWFIRSQLESICKGLYSSLINEGPPIYSEIPFSFVVKKWNLNGRIDEIRKKDGKIIIRDYKSGRPWMGEMKLDYSPQLTLYNIAVGAICFGNEEFARKLSMGEKRKRFMGNPIWANQDFQLELYMTDSFYIPKDAKTTAANPIHKTIRKNEHFFMLLKMIEETEYAVQKGNISPDWGRKCDSCDMKHPCKGTLDNINKPYLEKKTGQRFFDFAIPSFLKSNPPPVQEEQLKLRLRKRFVAKKLKSID